MDFFRGRRKKITHAQSFWASEAAGERAISWLEQEHMSQNTVSTVPSLATQSQEHKPHPDKTICLFSSFLFMSCFIFAGCPPPHPLCLPSRQLKTSERKEKEKGVVQTKAWFSARGGHAHQKTWSRCFGHGAGKLLRRWLQESAPQAPLQVSGPWAIMQKEGAVAPAPSALASWMCFWPTLPAGYLRSPHLLPAATWGRFLAKFSLPVANGNLNPFQRFFFWGSLL